MKMSKMVEGLIIEQELNDEWVKLSPDEYVDLLDLVNGIGSRIKNIKGYKGKKIYITGNLRIPANGIKITDIDSIDYVNGNLDIRDTDIKYFDKNKVEGNFSYYGSEMWNIERRQVNQKKLAELDELRKQDAWNINNGEDVSIRTSLLFNKLQNDGTVEEGEDKYFLYPELRERQRQTFEWLGDDKFESTYTVYTEEEADLAAIGYVEELLDELRFTAFSPWVFENNIDEDYTEDFLTEYYTDTVYESPGDWGVPLELSDDQKKYLEITQKRIDKLQESLNQPNITEEEKQKIKKDIFDFEAIIDDIKENPEGDEYDEDQIDEVVKSFVDENKDRILDFLDELGMDDEFKMNFIDKKGVAEDVINSDGYGVLSFYDGEVDEEYYDGETYYIVRNE
jgi:hypothetical protein